MLDSSSLSVTVQPPAGRICRYNARRGGSCHVSRLLPAGRQGLPVQRSAVRRWCDAREQIAVRLNRGMCVVPEGNSKRAGCQTRRTDGIHCSPLFELLAASVELNVRLQRSRRQGRLRCLPVETQYAPNIFPTGSPSPLVWRSPMSLVHAPVKLFSPVSTEGMAGQGETTSQPQFRGGSLGPLYRGFHQMRRKSNHLVSKTVPAKSAAAIAYP